MKQMFYICLSKKSLPISIVSYFNVGQDFLQK